ncbi:MAG: ribbon-helix-helix domain-containing protein [Candidatus Micrarchaeota archaeon]
MVSTFSLPRLSEDQITALVRAGYYSSKSDVIKDALRLLFKSKKKPAPRICNRAAERGQDQPGKSGRARGSVR